MTNTTDDGLCGDCITGRCHWDSTTSQKSETLAQTGGDYHDPQTGRCGCDRHRTSIKARKAYNMPTSNTHNETIATYQHGHNTYEIDHLGIGNPDQWGDYAIYHNNHQIAEFSVEASWHKPQARPPLPDTDELIGLAKTVIKETTAWTNLPTRLSPKSSPTDASSAHKPTSPSPPKATG